MKKERSQLLVYVLFFLPVSIDTKKEPVGGALRRTRSRRIIVSSVVLESWENFRGEYDAKDD